MYKILRSFLYIPEHEDVDVDVFLFIAPVDVYACVNFSSSVNGNIIFGL